jgi:hypothetical protein
MDTLELPAQWADRSKAGIAITVDGEPVLPLPAAAVLARIIRSSLQRSETRSNGTGRMAGAA